MITALRDTVIVQPLFDPTTSPGGIIIPQQAQQRFDQGIVAYIGPLVKEIKPGMHVCFSGYTGTVMEDEELGLYNIIPEKFIIAVFHDHKFDINGLYFRDKSGKYWTATYDMVIDFISRAAQESDWFRNLDITTPRPSVEELYSDDNS